MIRIRLLQGMLVLLTAAAALAAEPEPGWKSLFDGKTLDGWKAPDMSYWSVEDGAITGKITKEHHLSRTCTSSGRAGNWVTSRSR